MDWGRQMAYIHHFYFYLWDAEWGGTFWKTNAYAPFPIWLWLNGHEWAKRQLEKAKIGYEALDNGFRSFADPEQLQKICDRLGPAAVQSFFWRWLLRLPCPFTRADLRAGYGYELASASSKYRKPALSIGRKPVACGLKESFVTTWISVDRTKLHSFSIVESVAVPQVNSVLKS